jgi:hypothetical protein
MKVNFQSTQLQMTKMKIKGQNRVTYVNLRKPTIQIIRTG